MPQTEHFFFPLKISASTATFEGTHTTFKRDPEIPNWFTLESLDLQTGRVLRTVHINMDRSNRARKPGTNSISARWFEEDRGSGVNYSMIGAWVKFYLRIYVPFEHKKLLDMGSSLFVTDDDFTSAKFPYCDIVEMN